MRTIYKYELPMREEHGIALQGEILTVAKKPNSSDDKWYVWAIHDDRNPKRIVKFTVVGTGNELPHYLDKSKYVGTIFEGYFVFHVFAEEQR